MRSSIAPTSRPIRRRAQSRREFRFKLRLYAGSTKTYEFTSQFFFNDTLTHSVYTLSPYSSRGARNTRNASDGIYNSLATTDKAGLTLQTSRTADGYAGVINLGVNVG